jgi:putative photosynthetic complex assembly protein
MSGHSHDNMVPPAALTMAGALVALSVAVVAGVTWNAIPRSPTAAEVREAKHVRVVNERLLHFGDDAQGNVVIDDARTGERVATIGEEGGGFIRGVMRGLARERRQRAEGSMPPFRLTAWATGELTLTDTATGRVIELNGFGPTNIAAFARLLEPAQAA